MRYMKYTRQDFISLQDLLYRCQFRQLVNQGDLPTKDTSLPVQLARQIFKASAQFELHDVKGFDETCQGLKTFFDGPLEESSRLEYAFLFGKIAYFRDNMEQAMDSFIEVKQSTPGNPYYQARALLGIANVYYSRNEFDRVHDVTQDLSKLNLEDFVDLQISLKILRANYNFYGLEKTEEARALFYQALAMASDSSWTYFIQRALYGLARIAKKVRAEPEFQELIKVLRATINHDEALYFSYLVNAAFKEDGFAITNLVEFDDHDLRLRIRSKWVAFHERPLLYNFLRFLSRFDGFAQKEDIVNSLWPNERYNPLSHDLRIYNLARRVRELVEAFEDQPVILLSGRSGYKLSINVANR